MSFREVSYGLMKIQTYWKPECDEHPRIFPNMLRANNAIQIRVPIDDTHTADLFVRFTPTDDGSIAPDQGDPEVTYKPPHNDPPDALHPFTRFDMERDVQAQDHMAWETQGVIADRTVEHLASSDRGIVLYRNMVKREIEEVRQGLDPLGLVRDPDHEPFDTNLDKELREIASERLKQLGK